MPIFITFLALILLPIPEFPGRPDGLLDWVQLDQLLATQLANSVATGEPFPNAAAVEAVRPFIESNPNIARDMVSKVDEGLIATPLMGAFALRAQESADWSEAAIHLVLVSGLFIEAPHAADVARSLLAPVHGMASTFESFLRVLRSDYSVSTDPLSVASLVTTAGLEGHLEKWYLSTETTDLSVVTEAMLTNLVIEHVEARGEVAPQVALQRLDSYAAVPGWPRWVFAKYCDIDDRRLIPTLQRILNGEEGITTAGSTTIEEALLVDLLFAREALVRDLMLRDRFELSQVRKELIIAILGEE